MPRFGVPSGPLTRPDLWRILGKASALEGERGLPPSTRRHLAAIRRRLERILHDLPPEAVVSFEDVTSELGLEALETEGAAGEWLTLTALDEVTAGGRGLRLVPDEEPEG